MRKQGQSFIEFMTGIAVLVPLFMLFLDFASIIYAVQLNDRTCLSAARAAASGDPATATQRAQVAIARNACHDTRAPIGDPHLLEPVAVQLTKEPLVELASQSGKRATHGGTVSGYITVTTAILARPMLAHKFFTRDQFLTFTSKHTSPITYIKPANVSSIISSGSAISPN